MLVQTKLTHKLNQKRIIRSKNHLSFKVKLKKKVSMFYKRHRVKNRNKFKKVHANHKKNMTLRALKRNKLESERFALKKAIKRIGKKELQKKLAKNFLYPVAYRGLHHTESILRGRLKRFLSFYLKFKRNKGKRIIQKRPMWKFRFRHIRIKKKPVRKKLTFWYHFSKSVKLINKLNSREKILKKNEMRHYFNKTKHSATRLKFRVKHYKYKYKVKSNLERHRPILVFSK